MTTNDIEQLRQTGQFPWFSKAVELIETHISWVLLLDEVVYKIKKPLQFSFLDFRALKDRKFYCEQELKLNQRLAPEMYRSVQPICLQGGQLIVGGREGEIVDYALEMKRMDRSRQMNFLLEAATVTPSHIRQIAEVLAGFHQKATVIKKAPDLSDLQEDFGDILRVKRFIAEVLGPGESLKIESSVLKADAFLKSYISHFKRRVAEGWVVDGHGDLHSRNIFLLEEPVIFDCIEFNEHFRQVDVLDELGFLSMDLEYYGYPKLAQLLQETYAAHNPCLQTEADYDLLHYYKWYRANVRLKVNALDAMQHQSLSLQQRDTLSSYFELFHSYINNINLRQIFN